MANVRMPAVHSLSDGTTVRVRLERGIVGSVFHEVPSRKRRAGALMRIDTGMYLLAGPDRKALHRISHPDYAYAADDSAGAVVALAFFVEAAEASIKHAADEGIPVEDCY